MLLATIPPPAIVAPAPATELAQQTATPPASGAATTPAPNQNFAGLSPTTQTLATRLSARPPQDAHLFGDWLGIRTRLVDAGITPTLAYVEQSLGAVRGGAPNRFNTAGQFTAGLQFDMKKITGGAVPGTFQATIVRRHGESFNAEAGLNLLVNPLSIQGRGETWRFSQLWYRVALGKLDVKLGRMYLNEDFDQARCDFVSGYFCLGANTRGDSSVWPTNPVSQWAIRLQYQIARNVVVKTAAYQYNPANLDMTKNFYLGFDGANGVLLPSEVVWTPKIGGTLAGSYTLGFFYSNAPFADPVLNTNHQIRSIYKGTALVRNNEWSAYFTGRQQIVAPRKDGSHGLTAFLNASWLSDDSTPNGNVVAAGLNYTGAIPGRPKDEIGFAVGRGRLNPRTTDALEYVDAHGGHVDVRRSEYPVEAYYAIALTPGLTFQPDVQFIFDPAGDPNRRNVVLVGFKSSIVL
jgi:porin